MSDKMNFDRTIGGSLLKQTRQPISSRVFNREASRRVRHVYYLIALPHQSPFQPFHRPGTAAEAMNHHNVVPVLAGGRFVTGQCQLSASWFSKKNKPDWDYAPMLPEKGMICMCA